jgi:hypothetical protein
MSDYGILASDIDAGKIDMPALISQLLKTAKPIGARRLTARSEYAMKGRLAIGERTDGLETTPKILK